MKGRCGMGEGEGWAAEDPQRAWDVFSHKSQKRKASVSFSEGRTNDIMRLEELFLYACKERRDFHSIMQVFHVTPEQHLIPPNQRPTSQWWSWMTTLMLLSTVSGDALETDWAVIDCSLMSEGQSRDNSFEGVSMKIIVFRTVSAESMKRALCSLGHTETTFWLSEKKHQVRNVTKRDFVPSRVGVAWKYWLVIVMEQNVFILIQLIQDRLAAPFFLL